MWFWMWPYFDYECAFQCDYECGYNMTASMALIRLRMLPNLDECWETPEFWIFFPNFESSQTIMNLQRFQTFHKNLWFYMDLYDCIWLFIVIFIIMICVLTLSLSWFYILQFYIFLPSYTRPARTIYVLWKSQAYRLQRMTKSQRTFCTCASWVAIFSLSAGGQDRLQQSKCFVESYDFAMRAALSQVRMTLTCSSSIFPNLDLSTLRKLCTLD